MKISCFVFLICDTNLWRKWACQITVLSVCMFQLQLTEFQKISRKSCHVRLLRYDVFILTNMEDVCIYEVKYTLTPWNRDLPEKLTCTQLLKKFPEFYGTRRFITAFTIAHHLFSV